jgi:hypothetical protein
VAPAEVTVVAVAQEAVADIHLDRRHANWISRMVVEAISPVATAMAVEYASRATGRDIIPGIAHRRAEEVAEAAEAVKAERYNGVTPCRLVPDTNSRCRVGTRHRLQHRVGRQYQLPAPSW